MEYYGNYNWGHPGGSIVEKALKTRSPALKVLCRPYRLIGSTSGKTVARRYAEGQSADGEQDHRRTPAFAAMVSQVSES